MKTKLPSKSIENPQTLGEHIKKRRLELKILQKEVASILGVTESCITNWENNRNSPYISYYPIIIEFLGYNPFPVDTSTLGGQIHKYRIEHGVSQENLGKLLGVNESTIFHWEKETHMPLPSKLKLLENLINQKGLP